MRLDYEYVEHWNVFMQGALMISVIASVIILAFSITFSVVYKDWDIIGFGIMWVLVSWTVFAIVFTIRTSAQGEANNERIAEVLSEVYDNVQYDGGDMIASKDGRYVEAIIRKEEPGKVLVIELEVEGGQ